MPKTIKRITDTWMGKLIAVLLIITFALLLTAATDGKWYTLFLPSLSYIPALAALCIAVFSRTKIPRLSPVTWLTLAGGAYFLIRAWLTPDWYGKLPDISLVLTACIFYLFGQFVTISLKTGRILFAVIALFLLSCVVVLALQTMSGNMFTVLRPTYTLDLRHVGNTGFFGYKNFAGHFLVAGGFFCCAYAIMKGWTAWQWMLTGVISILASAWCHSRAIYPNILIGLAFCWLVYLSNNRKSGIKFHAVFISGCIGIIGFLAVSFLGSSQYNLLSMEQLWLSGGRFQLTGIACKLALHAPFFGNGAGSFENMATPFFHAESSPNMAHNEYAQCASEYGFIGLLIMVAILTSHLYIGIKGIVKPTDNTNAKALANAAVVVLLIALIHASMEFIWHHGALVAMGAFCAGIIARQQNGASPPKLAGKWDQAGMLTISLTAIAFYTMIAVKACPIWSNDWKSHDAGPNGIFARAEILKNTVSSCPDPALVNAYASFIASRTTQKGNVPYDEFEYTEDRLRQALSTFPSSYMTRTYLGIILSMKGEYSKADTILEPFTRRDDRFHEAIFPWKTVYVAHLSSWADSLAARDPGMALSIIKDARSRLPLPYIPDRPGLDRSFNNKLEMEELILESQGVTPDDTWKKRHSSPLEIDDQR